VIHTLRPSFSTFIKHPVVAWEPGGKPAWEEEEDVLVDEDIGDDSPSHIVVYNDDVNSFEWVIQCFMEVLRHSHEQAEQLSLIIHFKGKATVKTGSRIELRPLCEALLERGLSAELEEGT
jgi:ATP-dependent Clp protease adaptor protein ClpS